jgi:hypothetical protein
MTGSLVGPAGYTRVMDDGDGALSGALTAADIRELFA